MAKYDFMFYESYLDTIRQIQRIYSEDEARTFCMELIRYGVTRGRNEEMRPELEAAIRSIYPLIRKSKEHRDRTAQSIRSGFRKPAKPKAVDKNDIQERQDEQDEQDD